jgi:O-methyltransferase
MRPSVQKGSTVVVPPPSPQAQQVPPRDLEDGFGPIYQQCRPFTMTSIERMYALWSAVRYVIHRDIPGDLIECGVWRGGSAMLIALTLLDLGIEDRTVHLFDTFEGMAPPGERDIRASDGVSAAAIRQQREAQGARWCEASIDEVRANMRTTGYPEEHIRLVQGRVENSLPAEAPQRLSLLRLDTDWYESTLHELVHLYPRLSAGGVLIIDDYGHWQGAREATDEYFSRCAAPVLLSRIDTTGRMAIKA